MKRSEFINDLIRSEQNDPGGHVACILWSAEDVISRAQEQGEAVTKEEANDILDMIHNDTDCEMGITWTTIDCALDDLFDARDKTSLIEIAADRGTERHKLIEVKHEN